MIAVDDGSVDASNEIIRKYCAIDSRVVLIEQKNQGIVAALNNALSAAKGHFCARMDADDVSLLDRLTLQVRFLTENPEVVVVGGQGYIIDAQGDPVKPLTVLLSSVDIYASLLLTKNRNGIIHPAVMFRTEVARNIGGYREQYIWAEDLDFFLRMGECGKLANINDIVLYYRQHGKSVTDVRKIQQQESAHKAIVDARIRKGLPPLVERSVIATTGLSPSEYDYEINTASQAEQYGNRVTARKHFIKAFFMCPLRLRTWKVLLNLTMPDVIVKVLT